MYAVRQLRLDACIILEPAGTPDTSSSQQPSRRAEGREPTDPPSVSRHAECRKLRDARLLRTVLEQLFANWHSEIV